MNREELFWKYTEGNCSPEELAAVEKLLADDLAAKKELELIQAMNSELKNMEMAGPSMRFSKNTMEALPPNLYPPISMKSLVPSFWKKVFFGGLAIFVLYLLANIFQTGLSGKALPYTGLVIEKINNTVGSLSSGAVQFFMLTLMSLFALIVFDKLFVSKVKRFFE